MGIKPVVDDVAKTIINWTDKSAKKSAIKEVKESAIKARTGPSQRTGMVLTIKAWRTPTHLKLRPHLM